MQRPWWKHPNWIHLFATLGAVAGAIFAVYVAVLFTDIVTPIEAELLSAQLGLQNIDSGLSGMFFTVWIIIYTLLLGGMSGYFIVHLFGKYRAKLAPIGMIITGTLSVLFIAFFANITVGMMGRRAALVSYGSYFVYSVLLIVVGVLILTRGKAMCE